MNNQISGKNRNKSKSKSYDGPILGFKASKSNESKITSLFKDDDENKVKEYIYIYRNGDMKKCLIFLYRQVINLGDLYDCWGTSMKKLGQIVLCALSGDKQSGIKSCHLNEILQAICLIGTLSSTCARNYQQKFLV
jgi:hypothetical protein